MGLFDFLRPSPTPRMPAEPTAASPALRQAIQQEREKRSIAADIDGSDARIFANLGLVNRSAGGVAVTQDSALGYAAVWACVQAISQDIAALPLPLFRDTDTGKQKLSDHPAAYLLNVQANPLQLAYTFRQAIIATVLLWGNAYARIEWNSRMQPIALHFQHPRDTEVYEKGGQLFYRFAGDKRVYQDYDVLHLKGLSLNGKTGLSVLHVHRETVGQGLAAKKAATSFYNNGARLAGVLSTDQTFKDAAVAARMRDEWNANYGGIENIGKTAVLEAGLKYQSVSIPPADAQFIESANLTLAECARIFRVPPHKIGDLSRSTNNNIEQQSIDYVQNTLQPWLVNLEQELRVKLLSSRELPTSYFRHNVAGMLRADAAARGEFYTKLFQSGALSPNQIMELEEMNGIGPNGDRHFVQVNLMPLDKVDDILAAKQPTTTPPPNENDAEA